MSIEHIVTAIDDKTCKFTLNAYAYDEFDEIPDYLEFELSKDKLERIEMLCKEVERLDINSIHDYIYIDWIENSGYGLEGMKEAESDDIEPDFISSDSDHFVVGKNNFFSLGSTIKHCDIQLFSDAIKIDQLKEWFKEAQEVLDIKKEIDKNKMENRKNLKI